MQAWETMGVDASGFIHAPAPQQGPDPKMAMAMATMQAKQTDAQVKMAGLQQKEKQQQREAADRMVISQSEDKKMAAEQAMAQEANQTKLTIAQMSEGTERLRMAKELHDAKQDRTHQAVTSHLEREHKAGIAHLDRQHEKQLNKEKADVSQRKEQ